MFIPPGAVKADLEAVHVTAFGAHFNMVDIALRPVEEQTARMFQDFFQRVAEEAGEVRRDFASSNGIRMDAETH